MKFLILMFLFQFTGILLADDSHRYDNYQTYNVIFKNISKEALKEIPKIFENETLLEKDIDSWVKFWDKQDSVRFIIPPQNKSRFLDFLIKYKIPYELEIENLQTVIDAERNRILNRNVHKMDWADYHPLSEIYSWLYSLQRKYNNVKVVTGGRTYEGRLIKGTRIINGLNLPGVVIESGIHGREWITTAGTSWMINEILKSREPIWKKFNYLYFPSFNPDGYVFTWTKNRLWRKTRTVYKVSPNKTCHGADANRNWDVHWGTVGTATNYPCSQSYAGPRPFSEVETRTISQYLYKQAKLMNNKIYISYHSYSQILMFPYGYKKSHSPLYKVWKRIGDLAGKAYTKVHGSEIKVGQIFSTIYPVSGGTTDYYYEKLNATFSYVYEMRDKGRLGFILPPDQIIPVGQEHLASLKVILMEYLKYFQPKT